MKTITLTKEESSAYSRGERSIWREVKPGHSQSFWLKSDVLHSSPGGKAAFIRGELHWQFFHPLAGQLGNDAESPLTCVKCPYGSPGDQVVLRCRRNELPAVIDVVQSISVTRRDERWGWLLEMPA